MFDLYKRDKVVLTSCCALAGTWYDTGLGACGKTNANTDLVVAVSHTLYDNYPGATANPNK
ncbi:hypothetical protein BV25DRAFT_1827786 [Artomyces pyxidatus]|uniref:Uncharacterized protein n=1 Tax=Artomyces pyxidatus TaxID=48021 RepID=A0ACB8SXD9_9AGAM|nr:hypothetical protein BV25DRAFT_1827786 [Artomyces pyxidatus]